MRFRLEFLILAQKRQITFNCWYRWHNFKTQLSITVIQLRLNMNNVVLICADSWMRMWNTDPCHGWVTVCSRCFCSCVIFCLYCCLKRNAWFLTQYFTARWCLDVTCGRCTSSLKDLHLTLDWLIDWLRFYKWTRTIRVLYGLQVELFIFLKAADVSLLLQVFGPVEDVLLRGFVGNHLWSVCLTLLRVSRWETCWQSKPPDWLR